MELEQRSPFRPPRPFLRTMDRTNHVVALDVHGLRLQDKITPSLLELSNLKYVDLLSIVLPKLKFLSSWVPLANYNISIWVFLVLVVESRIPSATSPIFGFLILVAILFLIGLIDLPSFEYLDLSYADLRNATTWPQVIHKLAALKELHLRSCGLSTNMLTSFALADASTSLVALDLSSNYFDRILHAIVSLVSLSYLDLSPNILQGEFPDSMGNLIRLSFPDLSYNQLQGEFPDTLGNFSCLSCLVLSNNELQGEFPRSSNQLNESLVQGNLRLPNLKLLDVSENKFSGQVPNLSSCLSLRWLSLHGNMFNGTLTESIGYLPNVEHLDLSSNHLEGLTSEAHLLNLSKLRALDLSFNSNLTIKIHGVLPDLSSKIHLSTLDLSSSEFNGSLPLLPQCITDVYLSINKFLGTIANFCTNFRNFRNFYALDLSNNLFAIEISQDCFTNLMILTYLNLANNNFSGEIQNSVDFFTGKFSRSLKNCFSRSLKNCSSLIILDLGENKFTGTIPTWLGESMLDLGVLSLKSNKLYAKLQVLDISGNKISGTIPKYVKNLTVLSSKPNYESWDSCAYVTWKGTIAEHVNALKLLTIIDLSSNNLTVEIPVEVASLVGPFALNLSRNNLVGTIPRDIGRLELLNFLDLSKNNLSGSVPPTLLQMSHLGMLDLSFNNLFGRIPWDTHMQTFDASTYMGNPELCGPPLVFESCLEDEMPKKPKSTNNVGEVHENKFIIRGFYISMALGFIVAFWGVSGTLLLNKWCWNNVLKMFIKVEDWFYVNILVNKNHF
ncbi:Leucine-rich repeat protein [Handroanthus impetiginosus]|uniref:Leucine-rich repeat protein n=1 Tax=Handroanthus impetiginosus TaxID=429701 RepID=A0A2G9GPE9_9LAMI|nr:Leucine-rich repeat protein [Handroanthus impetiginosus]